VEGCSVDSWDIRGAPQWKIREPAVGQLAVRSFSAET
jgi:hypothetical protein